MVPDKDEIRFQWKMVIGASILLAVVTAPFWLSKCQAAEVFGEIGKSNYNKPDNMLWWQDGYQNRYDNQPIAFRLGVEQSVFKYFSGRISYYDLGKYKLEADATNDEPCYQAHGASPLCSPPVKYTTIGSMRGVALSGVLHTAGRTQMFLEAGLTFTRQAFHVHVNGYDYQEKKVAGGKMLGIGLRHDKLSFSVTAYQTGAGADFNNGSYPSGVDRAMVFAFGYVF